ncbi:hypothetical protein C922_05238 [Plasmodium inui San Antonio 1]|uniref:Pv-fam-d protein n=1 Tax=Plasmodium inui San Antonio 1 TaxID=1237626 RepID=W6ZYH3_9APIC|nr:hypothetical protein C922_05238 [Plasmodium inui San Antonio 1]EUD64388.1 hypothetical protein C922_05238 [Plasmodium inui San Antonio 1]
MSFTKLFFCILVFCVSDYSNEYTCGKLCKNKNVNNVLNLRTSRLLRGYEQAENIAEYENGRGKFFGLVDEDDEEFTSYFKSCMKDAKFQEGFNLLMTNDDNITSEYKTMTGDKCHKNTHPNLEYNSVPFTWGKHKESSGNKYDSQDFTSEYDFKNVKEYGNPNQNGRKQKKAYEEVGGHDYNYDDDYDDKYDNDDDYDDEYDDDYDDEYDDDYDDEYDDEYGNRYDNKYGNKYESKYGKNYKNKFRNRPTNGPIFQPGNQYGNDPEEANNETTQWIKRNNKKSLNIPTISGIINCIKKADANYQARLEKIVKEEKEKNPTCNRNSSKLSSMNVLKLLSPVFKTIPLSLMIMFTTKSALLFSIAILLIFASLVYISCRYQKCINRVNCADEGVRITLNREAEVIQKNELKVMPKKDDTRTLTWDQSSSLSIEEEMESRSEENIEDRWEDKIPRRREEEFHPIRDSYYHKRRYFL